MGRVSYYTKWASTKSARSNRSNDMSRRDPERTFEGKHCAFPFKRLRNEPIRQYEKRFNSSAHEINDAKWPCLALLLD